MAGGETARSSGRRPRPALSSPDQGTGQTAILWITRKYPPSIGGMQQLSYRLTTEIARHRPVRVIAWGGSQVFLPIFLVMALARAIRTLLSTRIRVVHLGDPVLAPLGWILRWLFSVRIVTTVHGLDVVYRNPLYQLMIRAFLRQCDGVVAISQATRTACLQRGVPAERCRVIPLGVDPDVPYVMTREGARRWLADRFGTRLAGTQILLTVGRLIPRKGVVNFITTVLPLIVAARPDTRYLVVGDGPDRLRIAKAIECAGLRAHVSMLGQVGSQALWAAYQACDLFVMPNVAVDGDIEGFGLVVLEAGIAERYVVASDIEGIRDAVRSGDNGVLVAPGDPLAQAQAIIDLLRRDREREILGKRARRYVVANLTWSRVGERYLTFFDEICHLERTSVPRQ